MPALSSRYTVEDQERMTAARNYFAWQSRLVARELGRRVVEVGCGIGNFTETLLEREQVVAVDADPNCVERLRRRFAGEPNLHAFVCDVASDDFLLVAGFRPDSCVALNVLEHIDDDDRALAMMGRVLPPGGVIVAMVPAFSSLYGPIDANLGHYRRYSPPLLRQKAERANLRVAKLRFVNLIGFFGWWINARVSRRHAQSERQIGIFDRWIVPAMSRLEERVPPPWGQSLLAVLQVP